MSRLSIPVICQRIDEFIYPTNDQTHSGNLGNSECRKRSEHRCFQVCAEG